MSSKEKRINCNPSLYSKLLWMKVLENCISHLVNVPQYIWHYIIKCLFIWMCCLWSLYEDAHLSIALTSEAHVECGVSSCVSSCRYVGRSRGGGQRRPPRNVHDTGPPGPAPLILAPFDASGGALTVTKWQRNLTLQSDVSLVLTSHMSSPVGAPCFSQVQQKYLKGFYRNLFAILKSKILYIYWYYFFVKYIFIFCVNIDLDCIALV